MQDRKFQEILDREAIRDCIYRYCRGIDRADEAALRASYWPDATDCHGAYDGSAEGFIQMALAVFATSPRNVHHVTNILIAFQEPGVAIVESYFIAFQRSKGGDGALRQVMLSGRYCDRFEKRSGEWRVTARTVVYDWMDEQEPPAQSDEERFGPRRPIGAPFPQDTVYALLKAQS
jgi:hypothetical protein